MTLTTRSIRSLLFALTFALALVVATPAPARAAGLTAAQVNAVIGLLEAFNVPAATVTEVRTILQNASAPVVVPVEDEDDVSHEEEDEDEDEHEDENEREDEDEDDSSSPGSGSNSGSSSNSGPDSYPTVSSAKPNSAQFMAAAKTDASTASSVLYGVIGANTDLRDWAAIMASSDPLAAARAATAAMYNGSGNYRVSWATRPQDRTTTVWAHNAGNFTFYKEIIPGVGENYVLALVDGGGYQLTSAANPDVLVKHILNFGFNKADLSSLQTKIDAAGFSLTSKTSWPRGFLWSSSAIPQDSLVASLGFLPESLYETMAGVTDFLAAVEMAPVYVITEALSDFLFQVGLY